MRLFQRGEYEFALFSGSSLPEEVAAVPLFKNYRCILLNEDHPLAAQPAIRTRDLAGETVLALSEGYDYGWLQELCLRNNVEINLIPVNDTMTIFSSPGSSRILSLSTGTLDGSRRLPEGVVCRFWAAEELQETAFQVSVCLLKGRELPEHTRALIDYMIDFCAKTVRDNSSYPYRLPA